MAHGRAAEGVTKGGPDPEQPAEEKAQPSPDQTSLMRGVRSKGKRRHAIRKSACGAGSGVLAAADLVEEVEGSERDLAPALIVRKRTESMDVLYCCGWRSFFFSFLA